MPRRERLLAEVALLEVAEVSPLQREAAAEERALLLSVAREEEEEEAEAALPRWLVREAAAEHQIRPGWPSRFPPGERRRLRAACQPSRGRRFRRYVGLSWSCVYPQWVSVDRPSDPATAHD